MPQIVEPDSAQMGHPSERVIPLPFTHSNICKVSHPDDHNYQIICDHLRDVVLSMQETNPVELPRILPADVAALTSARSATSTRGPTELLPIPPDNVAALRSARSQISTHVTFINDSSMEVTLYWIDHEGNPTKYWDIGPFEAIEQQTFVSHPWIACCASGIIAVFFPVSRASKAVIRLADELQQFSPGAERNLRSQESRISTNVTFVNMTRQTVTVHWINYEGNLVQYWTLATDEEIEVQTYVSHPWVIRDRSLNTIGVFLPRATESRAVIHRRLSSM